ncbi:hypothetical protein GH741_20085 [Aquibacillus halophilus]|uniref:Yip1 domain-containing protein n=1 Tax=Aquibacillus halophilus TaxID=930132 RepID=A0A6A8DPG8_9BACI|nr:YIP1 family protein [Aquibacillus halophilus]MRH44947.1 hypothetical protein [Aquibacillus halophilus]
MTIKESLLRFWLHPGNTIKNEVERNTMKAPVIIVLIAGIYDFFTILQTNNVGDEFSLTAISILAILFGPAIGYIYFLIGSWITDLIAGWFGGDRDLRRFRIAYAWASLPTIINLVVVLPFIFTAKETFFLETYQPMFYLVIDGLLVIPYTIYFVIAIKVFYGFSWFKAIIVYVLPAFLLAGLILLITLPFLFL